MGGCGLKYGAACARKTGRQQVEITYPQEVEGWSEVSTFFLYIGPLLQTTSDNALNVVPSQTGPLVVVGLSVPAQQKSTIILNKTLLAKSMSQNPRKHDEKTLIFSQNAVVEQIFE